MLGTLRAFRGRAHDSKAIEASPTSPFGYTGLGLAYDDAGDREKALATWNDGLQKAENSTIALNRQIARALIRWGRLDEADKPLEILEGELSASKAAGAAASPLANELRLLRCQWHLLRREFAQALNVLKAVNLKGPGGTALQAELDFNYGRCYSGLLQWDQAATYFDSAAKTDIAPLRDWVAGADAWEHAGRTDLAVRNYSKAIQDPDCPPQYRVNYTRALSEPAVRAGSGRANWEPVDQALGECRTAARLGRSQSAGVADCPGQGRFGRRLADPGRRRGRRTGERANRDRVW